MTYLVATYFNQTNWDKFGLNWLRQAKSNRLNGFIIGQNLSDAAIEKSQDLGFTVVPNVSENEKDVYVTLSEYLTKDQLCLFTQPEITPQEGLNLKKDIFCPKLEKSNLFEVVSPIANLQQRANAFKLIHNKIEIVYNGLLSSSYVLGNWKFWNAFSGFQNYLHEKQYLDRYTVYHELMINLFMSSVDSILYED